MTAQDRRAKNPLTGEDLVVRHTINETVDSACISVLRVLNECSDPISQTDVAQQGDISRQAVSTHLAVLRDRGFVNSHDTGVELTAGGLLLLKVIESCLRTIPTEAKQPNDRSSYPTEKLAYLTRSPHPISVLEELEKRSHRMSELQRAANSSPSRPTVGRILDVFTEYRWSQDDGGQQQITSDGTRVLDAYGDLEMAVEQLIKKAPWLLRLPPADATFPIHELADADMIVSYPTRPSVLWTALKLYDRKTSHFRALCSIFNPILFHSYRGLLELGIEAEAILDLSTYLEAIKHPQTQFVHKPKYDNYQPLVLDHAHTLGIGIYDDRKIAIGAYNELGNGNTIAMIISSNKQLVDWGIGLYESYRAKARPASEVRTNRSDS